MRLRAGTVLGSHRSSVLEHSAGHRSARCLLAAHQHLPATKARTNTISNDQHLQWPMPFAPPTQICLPGLCCSLALLAMVLASCPSRASCFPLSTAQVSALGASSWPFWLGHVCLQLGSLTSSAAVGDELPLALWGGTSSGACAEQCWKR